MKYIDVEIRKPLYSTFCYLRDIYINQAKKQKKLLRITIPQGVGVMSAEEWMDGAQYLEQVFLRPDEPMKLWGNYVKIIEKKEDPLVVEFIPKQIDLF